MTDDRHEVKTTPLHGCVVLRNKNAEVTAVVKENLPERQVAAIRSGHFVENSQDGQKHHSGTPRSVPEARLTLRKIFRRVVGFLNKRQRDFKGKFPDLENSVSLFEEARL